MKNYQVVFDPEAQEEALEAAEYIAQASPANAAKWFAGLEKAIASLRTLPKRCGLARESETLGVELRHYIYHSHRIIFRVEEDTNIGVGVRASICVADHSCNRAKNRRRPRGKNQGLPRRGSQTRGAVQGI